MSECRCDDPDCRACTLRVLDAGSLYDRLQADELRARWAREAKDDEIQLRIDEGRERSSDERIDAAIKARKECT